MSTEKAGIVAYGAYIPQRRLQRKVVVAANGWFNSALKSQAEGERAMANWDEDSVTMAVAAARDCLTGMDREAVGVVDFASTTFPFEDRLNAGIVAGALNLGESVSAHDHAATQRAGTSALTDALTGEGTRLVVAAEKRRTKAASPLELTSGDAAAAFLVGRENVIAELVASATRTVDFVDHYRGQGAAYDYTWEERWIRDEGYNKIVPATLKDLFAATDVKPSEVTHFCMPGTLSRIGAAVAKRFAADGMNVAVLDLDEAACQQVADEITAAGGEAVTSGANVADWAQAEGLIQTAVDTFGGLDVLVNNAGIVRDRMFANTSEEEFDAVTAVHLKGHFATMKHAAAYWRAKAKAGEQVDARIINTSSGAGLQGSVGQANYSAAKAGIAALTLVASAEMGRYGVTVNAIAPSARTRMTETVFADMMSTQGQDFDAMAPENVSPLVVWLGSVEAREITGKMFEVEGGKIRIAEGWAHGPEIDKGARWDPAELGPVVADLLAKARPAVPVYGA